MAQMIIASRIGDGRVVFMAEPGRWADSIDDGLLLENAGDAEKQLESALADAAAARVIDPYLIDVTVDDGNRRPSSIRESVRAFGPTIGTEIRTGK